MTTQNCESGAVTLFRMNIPEWEYIGLATMFSWIFTIACCLEIGLRQGLGIGLDLMFGWLVVNA